MQIGAIVLHICSVKVFIPAKELDIVEDINEQRRPWSECSLIWAFTICIPVYTVLVRHTCPSKILGYLNTKFSCGKNDTELTYQQELNL